MVGLTYTESYAIKPLRPGNTGSASFCNKQLPNTSLLPDTGVSKIPCIQ